MNRIGDIIQDNFSKQTQAEFDESCRMIVLKMEKIGNTKAAARALLEWRGGDCPDCSKPYRKVVTKNKFADFVSFAPSCTCEQEQQRNSEQVVDIRLKAAGVPSAYITSAFTGWDTTVDPALTDAMFRVRRYAEEARHKNGLGLIMHGAVGAGKTRCAVSVLRHAMQQQPSIRVVFLPMSDLLGKIIRNASSREYVEQIAENEIVVIDDLDKIATEKEWAQSQVFALFDSLYRENRALIGTTNCDGIQSLTDKFGQAVVSRWISNTELVGFPGGRAADYRIRERRT